MTAADRGQRVAVVTGAARGIGAGIAARLGADGHAVGILDIDESAAHAFAEELSSRGMIVQGVRVDVADRSSVTAAMAEVASSLGPVAVVVNNAGIVRTAGFRTATDRDWDDVMAVNVRGAFLVTQAAAPAMVDAGWGRVVNLSSIVASQVYGQFAAYHASKGAVRSLTHALAIELAGGGITVNAVAPGIIDTSILDALGDTEQRMPPTRVPLGRLGTPADIAGCVSFLVSDEASYITGETIVIDGGLTRSGVRMPRP